MPPLTARYPRGRCLYVHAHVHEVQVCCAWVTIGHASLVYLSSRCESCAYEQVPTFPQNKMSEHTGLLITPCRKTRKSTIKFFCNVIESDVTRNAFKGKTKDCNYYGDY